MSSNSHDSYDKVDMKDDDFGIRQNSVTYVKKNDLLWASSAFIPGEDVDECEAADDVGNEPEIKTNKIQANIMGSATTAKPSIMSINEKQKEIGARSKDHSFISKSE